MSMKLWKWFRGATWINLILVATMMPLVMGCPVAPAPPAPQGPVEPQPNPNTDGGFQGSDVSEIHVSFEALDGGVMKRFFYENPIFTNIEPDQQVWLAGPMDPDVALLMMPRITSNQQGMTTRIKQVVETPWLMKGGDGTESVDIRNLHVERGDTRTYNYEYSSNGEQETVITDGNGNFLARFVHGAIVVGGTLYVIKEALQSAGCWLINQVVVRLGIGICFNLPGFKSAQADINWKAEQINQTQKSLELENYGNIETKALPQGAQFAAVRFDTMNFASIDVTVYYEVVDSNGVVHAGWQMSAIFTADYNDDGLSNWASLNVGIHPYLPNNGGPTLVSVPNVVGKEEGTAGSILQGAGLVVGTVTYQASNTVAAGYVISQSPIGGSQVSTGSAVNLVVSTGGSGSYTPIKGIISDISAATAMYGVPITVSVDYWGGDGNDSYLTMIFPDTNADDSRPPVTIALPAAGMTQSQHGTVNVTWTPVEPDIPNSYTYNQIQASVTDKTSLGQVQSSWGPTDSADMAEFIITHGPITSTKNTPEDYYSFVGLEERPLTPSLN